MTEHRGWVNRKDERIRKELPEDTNREMWLPLYILPDVVEAYGNAAQEKADELNEEIRSEDTKLTPVLVINSVATAFENELRSMRPDGDTGE